MQKTCKRVISMLLAVLMLFGGMTTAFAAEEKPEMDVRSDSML